METLKAISTLWPSAGRAWELLNGCRPVAKQHESLLTPGISLKMQTGMRDGYPPRYAHNPSLTRTQSLSCLRPRDEQYMPHPQPIDNSVQPHNLQSIHPPHTAYPSHSYSPHRSTDQLFGPLNSTHIGDTSYIRTAFDSSAPGHNRSASVGSQRESVASGTLPSLWTDPFTDSSLLSSNYYAIPTTVDHRAHSTGIENASGTHLGGLTYVQYENGGF